MKESGREKDEVNSKGEEYYDNGLQEGRNHLDPFGYLEITPANFLRVSLALLSKNTNRAATMAIAKGVGDARSAVWKLSFYAVAPGALQSLLAMVVAVISPQERGYTVMSIIVGIPLLVTVSALAIISLRFSVPLLRWLYNDISNKLTGKKGSRDEIEVAVAWWTGIALIACIFANIIFLFLMSFPFLSSISPETYSIVSTLFQMSTLFFVFLLFTESMSHIIGISYKKSLAVIATSTVIAISFIVVSIILFSTALSVAMI